VDREMGVAGRCLGLLHHLFKGLAFEPAAVFAEMSVGLELRAVSSRVGAIIFVHCPTPTLAVHIDQHFDLSTSHWLRQFTRAGVLRAGRLQRCHGQVLARYASRVEAT